MGGVVPVVPPRNVSGLVPKENVTALMFVFAVTPERLSVNIAGPMTELLKFTRLALALA